jgi:hypothetical protein
MASAATRPNGSSKTDGTRSSRVNATYDIFGHAVTQAEIISVCLFVAGGALLWVQLRGDSPRLVPSTGRE